MAFVTVPGSAAPGVGVNADALSKGKVAVLLSLTTLIALMLYYCVGIEEGMTSLFGHSMVIHELVHDSRHLLGFPCH